MVLAGLCYVCGRPSTRSCVSCGRIACEDHLSGGNVPQCPACRGGRRE